MPKILQYPRTSFEKSIEVAKAAFELGGSCDEVTCAEKLGKKVSGGFKSILASAQKFGLIEYHKGTIKVTEEYKLIVHSYTDEEKKSKMTESFLTPQVFSDLFYRFEGKKLPIELLDKMLIREFGVESNLASRVSKYFCDGLRYLDLLDPSNIVQALSISEIPHKPNENGLAQDVINQDVQIIEKALDASGVKPQSTNSLVYTVHMYGPGLDTKIEVNEDDDILIVEATLRKIKKKLKEMEGNPSDSVRPN